MSDDLISKRALLKKTRRMYAPDEIDSIAPVATVCVKVDDIHRAPVVDAVPVVRCGECEKFWEYTESHKATVEKADGDCMIRCMVAPDDPQFCAVQKDDYCSMGKRKGAKMDGGADDE